MDPETPRYVTLLGATGQIRVATFQERSHLVVPVVALVEGVLHPANTDRPEFVPVEVIASAPQGWNGRPVVVGHPQIEGKFVSANSPQILESAIGLIFNSDIKDKSLVLEAWLDKEKMSKSEETQKMLAKFEAGKMIEVSVGALVSAEARVGVHNGKQYFRAWKNLVPDHIAFLHDGDIGACSNEAGCGAPRVAMRHAPEGLTVMDPVIEPSPPKKSLRERLFDIMHFRSSANNEEDLSDRDLREALDRSLRASEPGYLGIDSVFPVDNSVVYAVAPEDKVQLFKRSFKISSAGDITLAKTKEEVQPVTRFEPVNAQSCGCAGGGAMDKAQRVKALIDSGRFLETDRPWLEQIPEDRLSTLEAAPAPKVEEPKTTPPATVEEPKVTDRQQQQDNVVNPPVVAQKKQTAEEFIAAAPAEIQETLREGLRVQQTRRTEVVTALKATGRCDFTDEQLAVKPICELERLLKLADIPAPANFTGRVNIGHTNQAKGVPPPPSLEVAIKAARAVK